MSAQYRNRVFFNEEESLLVHKFVERIGSKRRAIAQLHMSEDVLESALAQGPALHSTKEKLLNGIRASLKGNEL